MVIYDAIAAIVWSRANAEWVHDAKLGTWEKPKGGEVEQVILRGAGRNNTQAIIDYVRRRTGLDEKLKALEAAPEAPDKDGPLNLQ